MFNEEELSSYTIVESDVTRKLMRNVYGWMTLALALTGLMAYYTAHSEVLLNMIFGNPYAIWILFIAELVLVFVLSARIDKLSFATAGLMFGGYSIINGMVLSSIFLVYAQQTITSAFFVTAGMFAAMALIGSFTKKDLSGIGRFSLMALIGLLIAMIVNMFIMNSMFDFIISIIGVVIFAGLTTYDAQKIKQMIQMYGEVADDTAKKAALMGALSLYLDFINLFLYILRIFGRRN